MRQTEEAESSTALRNGKTSPGQTSTWFGVALIVTVAVVAGLVRWAATACPI
jgi:hypothetical protein